MITYIAMIHKETLEVTLVKDFNDWDNKWVKDRPTKPWKDYYAISTADENTTYGYFYWFVDDSLHWGGKWMLFEPNEIPEKLAALGVILGASPIRRNSSL